MNLWDVRRGSSGKLLGTLGAHSRYNSTHQGWVWCLAASGDLLASGSFDSTVKLWDLNAGGAERGKIQSRAAVLSLSCQDHMLFSGSYDQKVSVYDTRGQWSKVVSGLVYLLKKLIFNRGMTRKCVQVIYDILKSAFFFENSKHMPFVMDY